MNIHEYQAKELLRSSGIPVLDGYAAWSSEEARSAAERVPGHIYIVKAQIHAGGRAKGYFLNDPHGKSGVRLAHSLDEVSAAAAAMLGNTLITAQTGPAGQVVRRVYVEAGCEIKRAFYLSILVDRRSSRIVIMASTEGGTGIEVMAEKQPGKILRVEIDPVTGLSNFHIRKLSFWLGLEAAQQKNLAAFVSPLYEMFLALDCSVIEINPLVMTGSGELVALDAKIGFDDSALYRHPELLALRDETEEDPREIEAEKHGLHYVPLDGSIGCMVNGAGLAMATMDIIKLYGVEPANFLDVGGGATQERVAAAFKIILSEPRVKGVLVNIFGGIMRCDVIAEGVVAAAREVSLQVPLVVRLEGTNVQLGKDILLKSGLPIIAARNLADAALKIAMAVKGVA
ncbi:MAG: ADP-forming succinate--CoA ligase subunit beta [Rhodospirillales bacterium]|nr:ADP-forming succinate--CoA ligase subunit beta [Rhodospirillales bacterium]MDE2458672.1 ADP-forming succinate--CoA ligase subunit beta [Rhodospirillales bacterium]